MSEFASTPIHGVKIIIVDHLSPQLRDFILFCANRRGAEWPIIYDEMTRVAGQRLFRGMGYPELKQLGLSFSLSGLDKTIELVKQATSQGHQQKETPKTTKVDIH